MRKEVVVTCFHGTHRVLAEHFIARLRDFLFPFPSESKMVGSSFGYFETGTFKICIHPDVSVVKFYEIRFNRVTKVSKDVLLLRFLLVGSYNTVIH